MKKILRNKLSHAMLAAGFLFLAACAPENAEKQGNHEVAISLSAVKTREMVQPVFASGLLSSETEAVLSFKIGGVIQKMYVKEGDAIRKGQLLATLDLTEINAQVIQARNGVDKAERDLMRVQNLYKDDAATLENVQDLTTAYNVARESLSIAEFNKKFAEIRAITNGRVVRKMKNQGELVSPGMPVLFVNDTSNDQWKLEAGVADKDWARLREGDKATVIFDAYPDEEFEGMVFRLAEGADPANGSYQVEVQVGPEGKKFAPGLFAEARIIPSQQKTYHVIPVEALVEGFGKNGFVFVMDGDSRVKKISVEVAFMQDNQVAVKKGLEKIEEVVTAGSGYLTEYSSVKVIKESSENMGAKL